MPKTTAAIEILPVEEADWITADMVQAGMNWAYRVISPFNPENVITGAMKGNKDDVRKRIKDLATKIVTDGKGLQPFARPIKNNLTGKKENNVFNNYSQFRGG